MGLRCFFKQAPLLKSMMGMIALFSAQLLCVADLGLFAHVWRKLDAMKNVVYYVFESRFSK